jgi:hypothetical protein
MLASVLRLIESSADKPSCFKAALTACRSMGTQRAKRLAERNNGLNRLAESGKTVAERDDSLSHLPNGNDKIHLLNRMTV